MSIRYVMLTCKRNSQEEVDKISLTVKLDLDLEKRDVGRFCTATHTLTELVDELVLQTPLDNKPIYPVCGPNEFWSQPIAESRTE